MKRWILVVAILLCVELALSKTSDKIHRKKNTSIKKKMIAQKTSSTKSPNLPSLDAFKELPTDDLEFIKELDKQFKLHGDKIKFKVERANSTKNSKRTIDGELGYGYQNNQHRYQFSQPRYMIYPYSQSDIPPVARHRGSHYRGFGRTEVTIEPSRAFELKEVHRGYPAYNDQIYMPIYRHQHQTQQHNDNDLQYHHPAQIEQQTYSDPVIVLRIPGPAKYATHLQALLQQYLEIRAAQYIKELQESEAQSAYQNQEQHYEQEQHYQQQHVDVQQEQPQHIPEHYPVEQVYQHVRQHNAGQKQQQQQQQQQQYEVEYEQQQTTGEEQQHHQLPQDQDHHHHHHHHHQIEYEQQPPSGPENQQYVYDAPTAEETPEHIEVPPQYKYVPDLSYVQQQQPQQHHHLMPHTIYGPPSQIAISTPSYLPPPPAQSIRKVYPTNSPHLQITENNPRNTHTKVIFTNGENTDLSLSYALPSVTPAPRTYQPSPTERFNHHTIHYDEQESVQHSTEYQSNKNDGTEVNDDGTVVTITQRPFNYHAHAIRQASNASRGSTVVKDLKSRKRDAPTPEEQFRKLNKLIDRLKKSNVENSPNHQE